MLISRFFALALFANLTLLGARGVSGQDYPNKPIRIFAGEPGGAANIIARIIAQGISGSFGQNVIIDNRPANLTPGLLAKGTPDGYTLLITGSVGWLTPILQKSSYDAVKDFAPIAILTSTPLVLLVHPSVPVNSVKELIALAKAKPGVLNYASGPTGGSAHLGVELFNSLAGVNIVRVPYKGAGPGLNALIAGEVQMMITNAFPTKPLISSGRVRALAVTSAKPSALVPGLPTVAADVPDYEFEAIFGALATAGTPATVIRRLNQEIVRVLNQSDVRQKFFDDGSEIVGSSPEQFAASIKGDMARLGKVIKNAGITVE